MCLPQSAPVHTAKKRIKSISKRPLWRECRIYEKKNMANPQVHKYAEYLGFSLQVYPELYPLMEQGLKAPLPAGWEIVQEGSVHYFVNNVSGQRQKDHPADETFRLAARRQIQDLGARSPSQGNGNAFSPMRNRDGSMLASQGNYGEARPSPSYEYTANGSNAVSHRGDASRTPRFVFYLFALSFLMHLLLSAAVFKLYMVEGMPSLFSIFASSEPAPAAKAAPVQHAPPAAEEEDSWF